MPFGAALTTEADLRDIYPPPAKPSVEKEIDHLDENCRAFIAHSPLMVLSTTNAAGECDASPKGGPPGFVTVLDDHRLGIPDLVGNNRLDSISNLVSNPGVALLFLIPGLNETMRVNGRATLTVDPDVLDACEVNGSRPKVVIGVDVVTAYIHCAKALRRGSVWKTDEWPDLSDLPRVACMLRDHMAMPEMDIDAVERRLEASYAKDLWLAGGQPAH